jgi:hypothetical protein
MSFYFTLVNKIVSPWHQCIYTNFKQNTRHYNLVLPIAVIPNNLGRNSSVKKGYAGKEVTTGRNSDTPDRLHSKMSIFFTRRIVQLGKPRWTFLRLVKKTHILKQVYLPLQKIT